MNNFNFKSLIPIVAAIAIFMGLTFTYFSPLIKGKVIRQSDMLAYKGIAKEVNDHREKYDEESVWSNSLFSGMPSYLFSVKYSGSLIPKVRALLTFGQGMSSPAMILFSYMVGFYILLLVLKVNPWLSIVGAIAFSFTSYTFIILEAGHITKAIAICYMPSALAGTILICRKKYLLGTGVLGLFMALELNSSHIQVTYYLVMMLAVYVAVEYVSFIKNKEYDVIGKSLLAFVVAAILSFGCNSSSLLNTMDYVEYTIRGKSELTSDKENKTTGLDRDYVVQWSMGKAETMSLMIPGFKGRSSAKLINDNPKALENVDAKMKDFVGSNMRQYWGDQPFTSACYAGSIVVFLFIIGLFIVEGSLKWGLLFATVLSILLSWGKNFMPLTDLFLDFLPGYNKFRTVSMIIVIAQLSMPLLGILAVDRLLKTKDALSQKINLSFINTEITIQNIIFASFMLTGGLSLLFYLSPDLTSFEGASDNGIFAQVAQGNGEEVATQFMSNVEEARRSLFRMDAMRSFLFITAAFVLLWMALKEKVNQSLFIILIGVFILADLWLVDKPFLNDDNFVTKREWSDPFPETEADRYILQDTDISYRVLNLAVSTFNDASTSYRHKSVGGYHAVKLRRYQDLIDHHLHSEMNEVMSTLKSNPNPNAINTILQNSTVLNMLNTRYLIYNPAAAPLQNSFAYGNAWFVKDIEYVANADEEIERLNTVNPEITALVDERYKSVLEGSNFRFDSLASIELLDYKANHLTYSYNASSEQLTVFSEVYYEDGWNAYIDGQLIPHIRTDYILRAMVIPSGKHTIEFKFEPPYFYSRQYVSLISSLVLFALIGFSAFKTIRK